MPNDPLDPADLLRFAAVADAGSFQAAADRLHVDRSVLSRRVAALEAQLGVQLLHRSTRALSLTEAGAAIVTRARALDELLGDVRRIAGDAQDQPRGLLRISAATHFGTRCVQPAVVRYQALYPQVAVELRLDNRRPTWRPRGSTWPSASANRPIHRSSRASCATTRCAWPPHPPSSRATAPSTAWPRCCACPP